MRFCRPVVPLPVPFRRSLEAPGPLTRRSVKVGPRLLSCTTIARLLICDARQPRVLPAGFSLRGHGVTSLSAHGPAQPSASSKDTASMPLETDGARPKWIFGFGSLIHNPGADCARTVRDRLDEHRCPGHQ